MVYTLFNFYTQRELRLNNYQSYFISYQISFRHNRVSGQIKRPLSRSFTVSFLKMDSSLRGLGCEVW